MIVLAGWKLDAGAVRALLEAGADVNAGGQAKALSALLSNAGERRSTTRSELFELLLQHGANCLLPAGCYNGSPGWNEHQSVLAVCADNSSSACLLLKQLKQKRASGALQLGSTRAAAEVAAACISTAAAQPLLQHSLGCLEALLDGAAPGQLSAEDADLLNQLLFAAVGSQQGDALVPRLLRTRLPFQLDAFEPGYGRMQGHSLLGAAAIRLSTATVRLLHEAGAPLAAGDLLHAAEYLSVRSMRGLLACGTRAVDTSGVLYRLCGRPWLTYSDPIHATLLALERHRGWGDVKRSDRSALHIIELLLGSGYRPTIYRDDRPPSFLHGHPGLEGVEWSLEWELLGGEDRDGSFSALTTLPELDPFNHYRMTADSSRAVFVARGGTWSRESHHRWPPAFKAATRALLLASHASSSQRSNSSGSRARSGLAALPAEHLMRIIELSAAPMSACLKKEAE
ncbi:hypothetical protein ABPG75_006064 [Micractinium tetrahymenae]